MTQVVSVYVESGADLEQVDAEVSRWREARDVRRLVELEPAADYPGFGIAIDIYGGSIPNGEEIARSLVEDLRKALPWRIERASVLDAEET